MRIVLSKRFVQVQCWIQEHVRAREFRNSAATVKTSLRYYTVNIDADVSKNEISSSSFTAQITTQKAT